MYHRDCYSRMMFNFPIVMKEMACPNYLKFVEALDKLKVLKIFKSHFTIKHRLPKKRPLDSSVHDILVMKSPFTQLTTKSKSSL